MSHINSDTASPHSDGMRINEGASAEALRHVRDWLDRIVRPIATIDQRDELDRYSYEWRETGECYEETDGDVTYTVPILRSVSYGRDEDVACAKGAVGSDVIACGCASGGSAKDGAIYVGVFDDDCAQADASCASGGLEPTAECAHAMPPADEGSGTPWFPDRWTPEGYYEMCDEGVGIQAFIQEYGQDFVSHDLGLPGFLGDAMVATSELGGAR